MTLGYLILITNLKVSNPNNLRNMRIRRKVDSRFRPRIWLRSQVKFVQTLYTIPFPVWTMLSVRYKSKLSDTQTTTEDEATLNVFLFVLAILQTYILLSVLINSLFAMYIISVCTVFYVLDF